MLALKVVYQFQDGKDYSWCYYHLRFVKEALSWGGGGGGGGGGGEIYFLGLCTERLV